MDLLLGDASAGRLKGGFHIGRGRTGVSLFSPIFLRHLVELIPL